LAPKDTGKGAASIATRIISSRPGIVVGAIGPGRNQFYMMFQEIGTSHHPPQPHLRPAVETKGREAIVAIGAFYREELRAFKRSGGAPRRIAAWSSTRCDANFSITQLWRRSWGIGSCLLRSRKVVRCRASPTPLRRRRRTTRKATKTRS